MLNDEQREEIRTTLLKSEEQILATAQNAIEFTRERDMDQGRDSIDQSNSEELLSTQLRLADREQKLLKKIRQAVVRLNDDTINECESCGEEIGFRRLLARPVTTLCIVCKEDAENIEHLGDVVD